MRRGKYVSPHLHALVAYLMEADENEPLSVKPDENSDVQWISINKMDSYSDEPHMNRVYNKIVNKIIALRY